MKKLKEGNPQLLLPWGIPLESKQFGTYAKTKESFENLQETVIAVLVLPDEIVCRCHPMRNKIAHCFSALTKTEQREHPFLAQCAHIKPAFSMKHWDWNTLCLLWMADQI
jgi:hypothetical protein